MAPVATSVSGAAATNGMATTSIQMTGGGGPGSTFSSATTATTTPAAAAATAAAAPSTSTSTAEGNSTAGISLDLNPTGSANRPREQKKLKGGLVLVFDGGEGDDEMSMEEMRARLPRYQAMASRANVSKAVSTLPCLLVNDSSNNSNN
jgi:hypothetical protein